MRHPGAHVAGSRTVSRTIAALTFSLLFLLTVFARPVLAQSADDTHAKAKAPKLVLSPDKALHFGKVIVGLTSAPQTITLTNKSSTTTITITDIRVSPPFVQTGDTCGGSIAASGTCTVSVAFKPTKHGRIVQPKA